MAAAANEFQQCIERVANLIAPGYSTSMDPVDLNSTAREWGVRDLLYTPGRMHGYTEWTANGPVIRVALSRSDGRRRFTLAHELGHLVVDPVADPQFDTFGAVCAAHKSAIEARANVKEIAQAERHFGAERLCDLIAVELLLPAFKMPEIQGIARDLTVIQELKRGRRVSLSMMVNRLNEFGSGICLLQFAEAHDGRYVLVESTGAPRLWRDLTLTSASSGYLADVGPGLHLCELEFGYIGGFARNVVEIEKSRNGVCAMLKTSSSRKGRAKSPLLVYSTSSSPKTSSLQEW